MLTFKAPSMIAAVLALAAFPALVTAVDAPVPSASPAAVGPAAPKDVESSIVVTLDELRTLLARGETPRLKIANNFGGTMVGRATSIEAGKILLDVGTESVGVDGVLGVPLTGILSIRVLVPLTPDQVRAVREATRQHLAALRAHAAPATDSMLASVEGFPGTDSGLEAPPDVEGADSLLAGPDQEVVDLLAVYPPAEGWGPAKLAEIVRKSTVLRLMPFGKDKTFLKDYDTWTAAYEKKRNEQLEEMAAIKSMNQPVPEDFELFPELGPVPSIEGAASPAPDAAVGDDSDEQPVGAPSDPTGD